MPNDCTTKQLSKLLDYNNKKFLSLLKNNGSAKDYIKIAENFQSIINNVEDCGCFKKTPMREFYKLKAQFGLIQCNMNFVAMTPVSEIEFQNNNSLLTSLGEELKKLTAIIHPLKEKIPKNQYSLQSYASFLINLQKFTAHFTLYSYTRQAVYYHNYAAVLLEQITKTQLSLLDSQTRIQNVISILEKSAFFYEKIGRTIAKDKVKQQIIETRKILLPVNVKNSLSIDTCSLPLKKRAYPWGETDITLENNNKATTMPAVKIKKSEPTTEKKPPFSCIITAALERIWLTIKNIPANKQLQFYSSSLHELVKFYIAPENQDWLTANNIPLQQIGFLNELTDWLNLARKLSLACQDNCITQKVDDLQRIIFKKKLASSVAYMPTCSFNLISLHNSIKEKLPDYPQKTFYQKFKVHIERLHSFYKIPLSTFSKLCEHLIMLIEKKTVAFNFQEEQTFRLQSP
jgi:hypothetical protein